MIMDGDTDADLEEIAYLIEDMNDHDSIFTAIAELNALILEGEYSLFSPVESDYKEPKTFKAMLKRPPEEREKWLEAVKKEFDNCEAREVWTRVKKKDVPKGRRLIGSKWVFKCKRDGRYRSRLVALGYTQIPGVDFTDNFSPVISDVTLRICLTIWLILDLDIDQMDVETAFLEGILSPNEYMYMLNPEGPR